MRRCEENIDWEVDQDRPFDSRVRRAEAVGDYAWDFFDICDSMAELRDRLRHNYLIMKTLKSICLGILQWRTGGDAEDRTPIRERCRQSRKPIGKSSHPASFSDNTKSRKGQDSTTHPLLAVTKQTPTFPETFAYPSAACTATVSCLVSINLIPDSAAPTRNASR